MALLDMTVVIACKNRNRHLEYCIGSIAGCKDTPRVIVVDFGSQPKVELHNFSWLRIIRVSNKTKFFHKARALNIGIKHVKTKFTCITDTDQLFNPNFFTVVYNHVKPGNTFVSCMTYALPKFPADYGVASRGISKRFNELLKLAKCNEKQKAAYGDGCCHATRTSWFVQTRGYDERFIGWGPEDSDVRFRAKQTKLKLVDVTNKTDMVHMWHMWNSENKEYHKKDRIQKNIDYYKYKRAKRILVGNVGAWGEM